MLCRKGKCRQSELNGYLMARAGEDAGAAACGGGCRTQGGGARLGAAQVAAHAGTGAPLLPPQSLEAS